ncbi:unannotated protein [freshwater metagenome]|uniref:Unannotated protein n=1 Tax=freshwater metagenome TaxID=449393 RepID=A0A6J7I361_9ZZZZ
MLPTRACQIRWLGDPSFDKSGAVPVNLTLTPRASLWTLRISIVALAIVMSGAISAVGEHRSSTVMFVATSALAVLIGATMLSVVVPSALSLTVVRIVLPSAVPAAAITLALDGGPWAVAALGVTMLASAIALGAETGEAMVQGSAYGDERRLLLKVPAALLPPIIISWLVWCAFTLTAVVLLSARQWITGTIVAALAVLLTLAVFGRLHRFSRRWLVIVPAGVVVHDDVVLGETLMVQSPNVRMCRLALADTAAADLTGPSSGHALEVTVNEMVTGVLAAAPAQPKGKAMHMQSFLLAPTRPGRALRAIADVKLPVG